MNKDQEEKLYKQLSSNEKSTIERFGDGAKGLILDKLNDGYQIYEYASDHVSVKKGFTYYCITRGGSIWSE